MCCCSVLYSHTMDLTTACLCVNGIAICVLFGVSCNIVMFYNVTKKIAISSLISLAVVD